jgi:hypothetical protein
MKIVGIDGMSHEQVQQQVRDGGRFVIYQYCFSILIMTFKRGSSIYFLKPGEGAVGKGLGFSALTFLVGWWGIPWGPIYTIQSLWKNFSGGIDVTAEVMAQATEPAAGVPMPAPQR